jgi:hypothetical protein
VNFDGAAAGQSWVELADVVVPAGETVTFRVRVPASNRVTQIEPYVEDHNWAWTSGWYGSLAADAWKTLDALPGHPPAR